MRLNLYGLLFYCLTFTLFCQKYAAANIGLLSEFQIISKSSPSRCLDGQRIGADERSGTITLWDCHREANQIWKVTRAPNGAFRIVNKHSNRALGIKDGSRSSGGLTELWEPLGDQQMNQLWDLIPVEGGWFQLRPLHSGKCLDADTHGLPRNGSRTKQMTCVGPELSSDQIWGLRPVNQFQIYSKTEQRRCLDVDRIHQSENAARVQLWDCQEAADNQIWVFMLRPDGSYQIMNRSNAKVLDIQGPSILNGARAHIWGPLGDQQLNQLWDVVPIVEDGFQFVSVFSDKCLDADLPSIRSNGSLVSQWECHGPDVKNQLWGIRRK